MASDPPRCALAHLRHLWSRLPRLLPCSPQSVREGGIIIIIGEEEDDDGGRKPGRQRELLSRRRGHGALGRGRQLGPSPDPQLLVSVLHRLQGQQQVQLLGFLRRS